LLRKPWSFSWFEVFQAERIFPLTPILNPTTPAYRLVHEAFEQSIECRCSRRPFRSKNPVVRRGYSKRYSNPFCLKDFEPRKRPWRSVRQKSSRYPCDRTVAAFYMAADSSFFLRRDLQRCYCTSFLRAGLGWAKTYWEKLRELASKKLAPCKMLQKLESAASVLPFVPPAIAALYLCPAFRTSFAGFIHAGKLPHPIGIREREFCEQLYDSQRL
jgi:hypothetical protein